MQLPWNNTQEARREAEKQLGSDNLYNATTLCAFGFATCQSNPTSGHYCCMLCQNYRRQVATETLLNRKRVANRRSQINKNNYAMKCAKCTDENCIGNCETVVATRNHPDRARTRDSIAAPYRDTWERLKTLALSLIHI